MENYLQVNVSGFLSRDPAKLLLLLWLFWISLSKLQTKFTSEIPLNNVNRYVPVKCTYDENYSLGNCLCPTIDGKFKTFSCHCYSDQRSKTYGSYFCSCVSGATQNSHIDCTCKSPAESLTVRCNVISNSNTIKVGVLIPLTQIFSTYQLGCYYHSAVSFALDYINNSKFLLVNHSLGLVWGDTECNKNKTITLTMKMIKEQRVDAIIAVGCESCLETAAIAGSNNIPMLSTVRETNFIIKLYRLFLVLLCLVFFQKKTKM